MHSCERPNHGTVVQRSLVVSRDHCPEKQITAPKLQSGFRYSWDFYYMGFLIHVFCVCLSFFLSAFCFVKNWVRGLLEPRSELGRKKSMPIYKFSEKWSHHVHFIALKNRISCWVDAVFSCFFVFTRDFFTWSGTPSMYEKPECNSTECSPICERFLGGGDSSIQKILLVNSGGSCLSGFRTPKP